jgi:hypothetical protein
VITLEQLLGILHFWALVTVGWLWLFACWRPYRLDALREKLFALRDELFLLASQDRALPFEHPAYRCLRDDLNGMIRFAEKMTFFRAVLLWLSIPREIAQSDWEKELRGLPLHTQRNLLRIRSAAALAVSDHVVHGSPILLVLLALSRVNHFMKKFYNRLRSWVPRPLEAQARV